MTVKDVLRTVLLLFVAYSLVLLAVKRFGRESDTSALPEQAAMAGVSDMSADGSPPRLAGHRVIVTYFHGRERCETCRNLEADAKEAVQTAFAEKLAAGQMEWRIVDFDRPQDAHYDQDYKLGGVPAVVVSEVRDGAEVRGRVLDEGFMLVATGTKEQVVEYLQREIRAFLNQ